jgi:exonuclease SbcC
MSNNTDANNKNAEIQENLKKISLEVQQLENNNSNLSAIIAKELNKDYSLLKRQKDELEREINNSKDGLVKTSVECGNVKGYLEELDKKASEKQVLMEEKDKISLYCDVYKKLSRAFGKDGIQAIIMENITEDLRNYVNSILQTICNEQMTVNFITQRQTTTGNWKEDFDIQIITKESVLDFEDLSGGEQVRIAIAMRLALSQLLMNRVGTNIKFLLLDEVDQALDRQGIDVLADTIATLSKEFKILMITHNELMKEKIEHIITVQKEAGNSILKQ